MKRNIFQRKIPNYTSIFLLLLIYIVVIQILNPAFLSGSNITNILRASGFILIPSIGMTLVLIVGGIDLSIGATAAFGGIITSILIQKGLNIPIALICGLISGTIIGLTNGIIIAKLELPSIIITLGMYYLLRGLVHIVSKNSIIYPLPASFQQIEQRDLLGIPPVVLISFLLIVIFQFVLSRTTLGKQFYAVGSDQKASALIGIKVKGIRIISYVLTGFLAALSGIFIASRLGSAQANAGVDLEFQVIAAVIIGGTSPYGGRGSVLGTLLGVVFMSVIYNSMTIIKIPVYWQSFIIGIVIIAMVIIDKYRSVRRK